MRALSDHVAAFERCSRVQLADTFNHLQPGDAVTVIGASRADLRARLDGTLSRHLLLLDFDRARSTSAMIDRVLDDLADLAAGLWPNWLSTSIGIAPSRPRWRAAAAYLAAMGGSPRFRRLAREIEIGHLLSVLPPLILVAEIDCVRPERAAAMVAALEWCQDFAAVTYLLPEPPPPLPPWQRVLHRAIVLTDEITKPASSRLLSPANSEVPGGSWIERRLRQAIHDDSELRGLFENEIVLHLDPPLGLKPRVDLLWRAGRVVVEVDGPEHERDPNYGADRHRDFELMIAGYLVLRLTNSEIELDLERALGKIRSVVSLRGLPS